MTTTPGGEPKSFGRWLARIPPRVWIALILAALGVAFIAQNRIKVQIRWLMLTVTSPLWIALLVVMLIGLLVGLLIRWRSPRRK
ncbi:lipopolysaccharide assembly protein LapA domain-containing protein [Streptosporangium sp. NPDC000396]|uniref:lipopolysaccharide assembly protein LapA domain-containing protein n=1 Tax=Streptosporangium sp. NPDC000396 TaxID=3366185 RepID=UPI00369C072B